MKSYPLPPHHIFPLADIWSLHCNFPREKYIQNGTEVTLKDKFQENYFIQTPATHPFPSSLQTHRSSQAVLRPKAALL